MVRGLRGGGEVTGMRVYRCECFNEVDMEVVLVSFLDVYSRVFPITRASD